MARSIREADLTNAARTAAFLGYSARPGAPAGMVRATGNKGEPMKGLRQLALAAIGMAAATALTMPPVAATAAEPNTDLTRLVIYNNNIENMLPASVGSTKCPANDWRRLITYMKNQSKAPDIFVVQQVSNQAKLDELTNKMNAQLPGPYTGILALQSTGSMNYTGACSSLKNHQTSAVIWRRDRFETFNYQTDFVNWRSDAPRTQVNIDNDKDADCVNIYDDRDGNSQDRTENLAVRLKEKKTDKHVTVASIHWPRPNWGGPDCADENMREASAAVDSLGGSSLKIIAGDANTTVGSRGWWNDAHNLYKYADPIGDKCPSSGCDPKDKTNAGDRIDYLLVKSSSGASALTVPNPDSASYSDHSALKATVAY